MALVELLSKLPAVQCVVRPANGDQDILFCLQEGWKDYSSLYGDKPGKSMLSSAVALGECDEFYD